MLGFISGFTISMIISPKARRTIRQLAVCGTAQAMDLAERAQHTPARQNDSTDAPSSDDTARTVFADCVIHPESTYSVEFADEDQPALKNKAAGSGNGKTSRKTRGIVAFNVMSDDWLRQQGIVLHSGNNPC